jgi:hypothetical protein
MRIYRIGIEFGLWLQTSRQQNATKQPMENLLNFAADGHPDVASISVPGQFQSVT